MWFPLPLRLRGKVSKSCKDDVARVFEFIGLESFPNVYPRELSGGLKMCLYRARAMLVTGRLTCLSMLMAGCLISGK